MNKPELVHLFEDYVRDGAIAGKPGAVTIVTEGKRFVHTMDPDRLDSICLAEVDVEVGENEDDEPVD